MMKFRLLFVAAGLLVSTLGFAQEPIRYGLKAGVNLANYNANVVVFQLNTKNLTSFYVTGFADIPLANSNFYLQPGVSFQGKGGKLIGEYTDNNNKTYKATLSERPYWLEIPVNVVGKMDIGAGNKFFVGAGPYVAFGVGGDYKVKTSGSGVMNWIPAITTDLNFGSDGHLKTTDFGLNFLAGFELVSGFGLQAGYGLGLSDIGGQKISVINSTLTKFDQKNRVLSFGLFKSF